MSTSPSADRLADSAFLCEVATSTGIQTLLVFVRKPHAVGSDVVFDACAMCCGPLDSEAARPGALRDAVVMTAGDLSGGELVLVAPDLRVDAVLDKGSAMPFLTDFCTADKIRRVFPSGCGLPGSIAGVPSGRPAGIPVPFEAYLLAAGRCAAEYQASLDSGFDAGAVASAVDDAVHDILMEHIVFHFIELADASCVPPASASDQTE